LVGSLRSVLLMVPSFVGETRFVKILRSVGQWKHHEAQDRASWYSLCTCGLDRHVMAPPLSKPFLCAPFDLFVIIK